MKNFWTKILIVSCLFLTISLTACTANAADYDIHYISLDFFLDTMSDVKVEYKKSDYDFNQLNQIKSDLEDILIDIERNFSISNTLVMDMMGIDKSSLMLVNERSGTGQKTKVTQDFIDLLKMAISVAEATNSGFDPTIGSLTTLWQISKKTEYCRYDSLDYNPELCYIPTEEQIDDAMAKIDYRLIEIDEENKEVYLPIAGMKLDLGAIAKGYAADKVVEYLKNKGFDFFLVNLGGNAYNYGESVIKPGEVRTFIVNPFAEYIPGEEYRPHIISVNGNSETVVTSGVYERYIEVDDQKYHHILNPLTGYPFDNNLMSVTITMKYKEGYSSSAFADAFATGVYALGLEEGLAYVESRKDLEAIFITKDKKVYLSSKLDYNLETGLTEEFELYRVNKKINFTPINGNTDAYNPTQDLLIALVFIVVGFGAIIILVYTLRTKKESKEE